MNREERRWGVTRKKGEGDQRGEKVTSGRRESDMGKKLTSTKKYLERKKKETDEKICKEKNHAKRKMLTRSKKKLCYGKF